MNHQAHIEAKVMMPIHLEQRGVLLESDEGEEMRCLPTIFHRIKRRVEMDEIKLKALEIAIGYCGKELGWIDPIEGGVKGTPPIEEVAKVVIEVALIFEGYLRGAGKRVVKVS